ncbi:MAG: polyprenyl synthetase family protein [Burkholderiales bacterium]
MPKRAGGDIVAALGLVPEMALLKARIRTWIERSDPEIREALRWQFDADSKYFRPFTLFSCHRAVSRAPISPGLVQAALVVEMFHNVSLIVDDIVDKSATRRGKQTLHCRFGELQALMVSGYIVSDGYDIVSSPDSYAGDDAGGPELARFHVRLFSELMKRLGVAECMQWRLRRQPLGVEDWRRIAGEDTGSMFEVCACLGARSERLREFGRQIGTLYHGCDDVGDVRGARALGGGGNEDLRDGILTLPAALAIRDPATRAKFCKPAPSDADLRSLGEAFAARLDDAERILDQIAHEAKDQARRFSNDPGPLCALVDHTRELSRR